MVTGAGAGIAGRCPSYQAMTSTEDVHRLHREGFSIRAIATRLGLSRMKGIPNGAHTSLRRLGLTEPVR